MTDSTQAEVPAGMKPWHGGDSAPDDWDGGDTRLRCGVSYPASYHVDVSWQHDGSGSDIIAYTPTPSTSVQGAGEAIYVRYSDDGQHIRKWSREPFYGAATYVSTPPAPASVADEARAREVLASHFETGGYLALAKSARGTGCEAMIAAMLAFAARPAGEGEEARKAVAKCLQIVRETSNDFLSDEYAIGQPISSFKERFACSQVADAICTEFAMGTAEQRRLLGMPTMAEEYRAALATEGTPS